MFDFRYHVASLAAVFLALVLGILVGVAISDPGLADKTSKSALRAQIDRLNRQLDEAESRVEEAAAARAFMERSYEAVMAGRLEGRRIVLVSIAGPLDDALEDVEEAVAAAGGVAVRVRVLRLPETPEPIERALARDSDLAGYVGDSRLGDLGGAVARELVAGGETPLLDALSTVLVEQQTGSSEPPADGAVVVRSARQTSGPLARFLTGLYGGLAAATGAVGAEMTTTKPSAVRVFSRAGLATVDNVDTRPGKLALVVLLAGGGGGDFGVKETADEVLPPVPPLDGG